MISTQDLLSSSRADDGIMILIRCFSSSLGSRLYQSLVEIREKLHLTTAFEVNLIVLFLAAKNFDQLHAFQPSDVTILVINKVKNYE